ncbi:cyclin-domain-containing protein [Achaetomium macrosporum]|uniref:Cyclin-domain-containing protein n=1 Tax=Achaetomium macrosporum TaxID=79813 RepID=A0AAN7H975_9PEZI|nr:cyclin-domain-containing protein [Achaetomium macrosporum]
MPQTNRRRSVLNERPLPNGQIFQTTSRYPAPLPTQARASMGYPSANQSSSLCSGTRAAAQPQQHQLQEDSRQPNRLTPTSGNSPLDGEQGTANTKMTQHSMSIPERISPTGGSISDFMAEVAALFWFESTRLLEQVEKRPTPTTVQPLSPSAVASQHFRKWVSSVLSTTQVTQNVVILALLYIYRLKKANPTVKGRAGSEYRLLTVALMLGNKFLDDNTYTNKTWADVSGISVNEIHVMEVEFLSNMRYSLLVSAEEWEGWLNKLGRFWSFLDLAQRAVSPSPSPLLIPSPTHQNFVSPLHSPTVPLTPGVQSASHSFSFQSPNLAPLANGTQNWTASYDTNNALSPLALKPEPALIRKRRFPEKDQTEPPTKRMSYVAVGQGNPVGQLPSQAVPQHTSTASQPQLNASVVPSRPAPGPDQGRLPVPSLTLNTAQAAGVPVTQAQSYGAAGYAPPPLSLPPIVSAPRAMSMVFPTTTTTYAASQPIPATCVTVTPTTSFPPMSYGTPTKRLSPQDALAPYPNSSPLIMGTPMGNTGTTSGLHTPISHSPSIYLQQRNSPYKPVRHVNTLLYPPPSAFLQQYHLPNQVLPNQMHYQPLGKRNEYRTGIVPEYSAAPVQYHQAVTQLLPNPHPHSQQSRSQYQQPTVPSYSGQY